jgi:hypothetical protein
MSQQCAPGTNPITVSRRFGSRRYPAPVLRRTSNGQSRFRGAPGAQLLGLRLLGVFEVVVSLDEEKPGTLPVADCMCLLQAIFCFCPPQIDASHQATPRCSHVPHCSRQSWQNVGIARNFGIASGCPVRRLSDPIPSHNPRRARCVLVPCGLFTPRRTPDCFQGWQISTGNFRIFPPQPASRWPLPV